MITPLQKFVLVFGVNLDRHGVAVREFNITVLQEPDQCADKLVI